MHRFGWFRDELDLRDYTPAMARTCLGKAAPAAVPLPDMIDLRADCPPVQDQGNLGSCTAHAAASMMAVMAHRAGMADPLLSRLYIYWVTRRLLGLRGDSGASLRATMGALVAFGSPPETFWPYTDQSLFDKTPTFFEAIMARRWEALTYFRVDAATSSALTLGAVQLALAGGLPVMFGWDVYAGYTKAQRTGVIPIPKAGERIVGGHAVLAVGYSNIKKGVLFRNSWGEGWGQAGYGWLPYWYVENAHADDFWACVAAEHLATGQFGW